MTLLTSPITPTRPRLSRNRAAQASLLAVLVIGSFFAGLPLLALAITFATMFALNEHLPRTQAGHKIVAAAVLGTVAAAGMLLTRATGTDCIGTYFTALILMGFAGYLAEHP